MLFWFEVSLTRQVTFSKNEISFTWKRNLSISENVWVYVTSSQRQGVWSFDFPNQNASQNCPHTYSTTCSRKNAVKTMLIAGKCNEVNVPGIPFASIDDCNFRRCSCSKSRCFKIKVRVVSHTRTNTSNWHFHKTKFRSLGRRIWASLRTYESMWRHQKGKVFEVSIVLMKTLPETANTYTQQPALVKMMLKRCRQLESTRRWTWLVFRSLRQTIVTCGVVLVFQNQSTSTEQEAQQFALVTMMLSECWPLESTRRRTCLVFRSLRQTVVTSSVVLVIQNQGTSTEQNIVAFPSFGSDVRHLVRTLTWISASRWIFARFRRGTPQNTPRAWLFLTNYPNTIPGDGVVAGAHPSFNVTCFPCHFVKYTLHTKCRPSVRRAPSSVIKQHRFYPGPG